MSFPHERGARGAACGTFCALRRILHMTACERAIFPPFENYSRNSFYAIAENISRRVFKRTRENFSDDIPCSPRTFRQRVSKISRKFPVENPPRAVFPRKNPLPGAHSERDKKESAGFQREIKRNAGKKRAVFGARE